MLLVLLGVLVVRGSQRRQPTTAGTRPELRYGDLAIDSQPSGAAVYMLLGRSPVEAPSLDIGQQHELLVRTDDEREMRARLAPEAWRRTARDGKPEWRAELRIDLAGAPAEPLDDPGVPRHALGTARIETEPPTQQVWMLVGYTPHMKLEDLRVDRAYEFLVARDGYAALRVRVGRAEWNPTGLDYSYDDGHARARGLGEGAKARGSAAPTTPRARRRRSQIETLAGGRDDQRRVDERASFAFAGSPAKIICVVSGTWPSALTLGGCGACARGIGRKNRRERIARRRQRKRPRRWKSALALSYAVGVGLPDIEQRAGQRRHAVGRVTAMTSGIRRHRAR